ncbi:MAG TPA: PH domain-containing protein [Myxococcota bacterium]|nr:PH domain-containing protein [Myxococcota bacterium]HRY95968.1 PH domain-containing protein [Myxococcota bacterium]
MHRSKVDWWLFSLVFAGLLVSGLGGAFVLVTGPGAGARWTGGFGLLVCAAVLLLTWPVRYEITPEELRVRAGLVRWRLPLAWIRAARLSSNPLSAPAWSLRRLRLDYRRPDGREGFQLLSPRDREAFLRELAAADPGLELDEDRWVLTRRPPAGA